MAGDSVATHVWSGWAPELNNISDSRVSGVWSEMWGVASAHSV